jgi:uncharacterized protein (DUF2147 family)
VAVVVVDAPRRAAWLRLVEAGRGNVALAQLEVCRLLRAMIFVVPILALPFPAASAADLKEMIGSWRWQAFTIEVSECRGDSICATVIAGPKNVGMEVFASKLSVKNGDWFGQITHPETKQTYNTRFQQQSRDIWRLDGCTAAKVCLTGEFVRVK